jgi:hypothetical protein
LYSQSRENKCAKIFRVVPPKFCSSWAEPVIYVGKADCSADFLNKRREMEKPHPEWMRLRKVKF